MTYPTLRNIAIGLNIVAFSISYFFPWLVSSEYGAYFLLLFPLVVVMFYFSLFSVIRFIKEKVYKSISLLDVVFVVTLIVLFSEV